MVIFEFEGLMGLWITSGKSCDIFGEAGIEEALLKWPVHCIYGKHCNC
jgi:hypothetical protein